MRFEFVGYICIFWNQDSYGVLNGVNLYGSYLVYIDYWEIGIYGVLFLNLNGMDVLIDEDEEGGKYFEYNILGGVFDFYFFVGDLLLKVVEEYGEIVGWLLM